MRFFENQLYHIYNRGNNKQRIFFSANNYFYFLRKIKKHIFPVCRYPGVLPDAKPLPFPHPCQQQYHLERRRFKDWK